ncbi:similar to Saccharomyces cerevisiae YFL023W BUD27 Unconventional prefoldin protein involved in translation initiation [Maudiozyma saulgeensis]|uniref:Similar to Saccharomyces cerevisiae YFL023W BUD27 Unconventional prefoldin protein involved in translation initiation n=1 Tax=Maudiozyma saulgeensis TaxID=1789683 RepID=A0A1X7QYV2_9SACH|nr:similar to Saccharomyces cerevisiae YFL023W BUD27 Unconventional prefoldin protein involved in translation initiation [Kazachstania saulgeensis]
MENEYDALANTVQKTLDNLQNKKDFLIEQQHHYTIIKERLLKFKENNHDSNVVEEKGDIFGDIIISQNKIFLSIGYEYYIEKTVDQTIEFVNDKLELMIEAIEQFDLKIKEANNTLKNLQMLTNQKTPKIKMKKIDNETDTNDNESDLPTMEIREELDEEGNVLNGSVVPAATESERQKIEDLINNNLVPKVEELKIEQNGEKQEEEEEEDKTVVNGTNEVDTADIYSFADLVEKMDEQDEQNDGIINPNEISYDYEKFQSLNNENDTYTDEEYEDDDEDNYFMMPGHSSFMDQINKLRNSRAQPENETIIDVVEKSHTISKNESNKGNEKSIMKKNEESSNKTKKNKVKKSVGFAPSLDVHEVESFKAETKKQTFNFPRNSSDLYSSVQDMMTDDTNNPNLHEFDNDLFASMIGAKQSDEIHDKYKDSITSNEEGVEAQASQEQSKKVRVSRFKKDRGVVNKKPTTTVVEEVIEKTESHRAVSDVIVEREIIETIPDSKPKKRVSKFAQRKEAQAKSQLEKTSPVIKKQDVVSDIIENPQQQPEVSPSTSVTNASIHSKKIGTPFKKNLSSLNKPRHSLNKKAQLPQELLDSSSDSEQEQEEQAPIEREIPQKKIEEIDDSDDNDDDLIFPKEVKDAIEKVGKTEDSLRVANVDYSALVDNMDDMIQAYTLGVYDDDLEEHPGTVVEKVEDFNTYNKEVDELKDDIIDFKKKNPMVPISLDDKDDEDVEEDNGLIMTDIVEKDIPANYRDIAEEYENNLGLHPDNISEAVTKEYHTLRQRMLQQMKNTVLNNNADNSANNNESNHIHSDGDKHGEDPAIEPLDVDGNPIRISRFKSQRMKLNP